MTVYLHPSGALSDTYLWYHQEKEKQRQGLDNELDRADIIQAKRGVVNNWLTVVKKYPKLVQGVIDGRENIEWEPIAEAYAHERLLAKMPF